MPGGVASLQTTTGPSSRPPHAPRELPPRSGTPFKANQLAPTHAPGLYPNKNVICRLTITPIHKIKIAAPMWSKILPLCGHKVATTRWPAGEGSKERPGLQGRAVGGDQVCRER